MQAPNSSNLNKCSYRLVREEGNKLCCWCRNAGNAQCLGIIDKNTDRTVIIPPYLPLCLCGLPSILDLVCLFIAGQVGNMKVLRVMTF